MYRVNFTCWVKPNPLNKKPDVSDCISYWYEEVGNDIEQLKANARKAWGENKGPKRFRLSQIVKGGTDILIEEHNI
jgi:hypothetical protein